MNQKPVQCAGFTLIELSVVLVIIGLIVGGVLVGRELIAQAQIRGTVTAMERYKTAYNTFLGKYNCVPGDCANASNFGLPGLVSTPNSQNGDGDGYIYSYNDGSTIGGNPLSRVETWGALSSLYAVGLIQDWITSGAGNPNTSSITSNLPIANGFMFFTSLRPKNPPAGFVMPDKDTNYLYIGTYPANLWDFNVSGPVLTPSQAQSIDLKIDDGMPMTGTVKATLTSGNICDGAGSSSDGGPCFNTPSQGAGMGNCVNNTASPSVYNIASSQIKCSIHLPVE